MWHPFSKHLAELGDTGERVSRFKALALVCEAQEGKDWDPGIRDRIVALLNKGKSDPLDPYEIIDLEALMMRVSPDEFLLQWRQYLESDYRALYGAPPAAATGTDGPSIRAGVIALSATIQRLRSSRRTLGLMRSIVCLIALIAAGGFFTIGAASLGLFNGKDDWKPLSLIVVLVGALGGFISGLSRLYSLSWEGDLLWTTQSVPQLGLGVGLNLLLAVLEGGVFSLIIYVLFASENLSGSLFPKFTFDVSKGVTWTSFVDGGPASGADIAKAIVWAFAAGFSERLVPDLLAQLAGSAKSKDVKSDA